MDIGWLVGLSDPICPRPSPLRRKRRWAECCDRLANINLDNHWVVCSAAEASAAFTCRDKIAADCSEDRRKNELQMSVVIHGGESGEAPFICGDRAWTFPLKHRSVP